MGYLIDRAKERIGRVKADRATDMGIAGHQAAMDALSSAAGHGRRGGDSSEQTRLRAHFNTEPDLPLDKDEDGDYDSSLPIPINSSKYGAKSPTSTAKIEPNVIDRHKPSEDF